VNQLPEKLAKKHFFVETNSREGAFLFEKKNFYAILKDNFFPGVDI